jgi:hypothetical protein
VDFLALREDVLENIKDNMSVVAGGVGGDEFGEVSETLTVQFQSLGICNLLIDLDTEGLSRNLCQSAFARRFFLRKSLERVEPPNLYWAISRTECVFDAIAAGADSVARDIVGLSPLDWMPDGEYEDDFCYFKFVHELVRANCAPDPALSRALLDRFERAVAQRADIRHRLCSAAISRDPAEFWPAFEDYVHERQILNQVPPMSDDSWLEPPRQVWIEGLAWLRIADHLGLKAPQDEYPLLPAPARLPALEALPTDLFLEMESQLGL